MMQNSLVLEKQESTTYLPLMLSAAVFLLVLVFTAPPSAPAKEDPSFQEYLAQAEKHLKKNRQQEAGEALQRAAALAGTRHPFLHIRLAKHYHQQGLVQEATAQAEKAVRLAPSDRWFRYDLAELYLAGKHYDKAEKTLCTLLQLDPGFTSGYASLAGLYFSTKRYGMARLSGQRAKLLGYRGDDLTEILATAPVGPVESFAEVTRRSMLFRFIKVASTEKAEAILHEISQGRLFEDFDQESMNSTIGEAEFGTMQSSELPEALAEPLRGMSPYTPPVIIKTGRDYRIVQRILPFDPAAWRLIMAESAPSVEDNPEPHPGEATQKEPPAAGLSPAAPSVQKDATAQGERRPPAAIAVLHALEAWKDAWQAADIDGYFAAYSQRFVPPDGITFSAWKERRLKSLIRPKAIRIKISDTVVETLPNDQVLVTFKQRYESDNYRDTVIKSLTMIKDTDGWKILGECVVQELAL